MNAILSKNIYLLRRNAGLKVTDLCAVLGIPEKTYYNYEEGTRQIPNDLILKIADYYDVTIDSLFNRADT